VPDNSDATADAPKRWRRTKRQSQAPREVILGLDQSERNFSFFGGVVAIVLALIFIPKLTKNTWITETAKPKGTTCPTGYTYHASECTKQLLTHPSYWLPQFLIALIMGLVMLAFAYRRKRAGVVTCALLLGLSMGTTGFVFLLLGGWLVVRAFRLQKFGDATFKGSNVRAREMAKAKKEGRILESSSSATSTKSSSKSGVKSSSKSGAKSSTRSSTPAPSKRYTPKQQPRKR
jgi:hypothetical protein